MAETDRTRHLEALIMGHGRPAGVVRLSVGVSREEIERERDQLWALALSQEDSRVAERVARKFNELREITPKERNDE